MKAIIGLGNPGKVYKNTRHNTGFLILDKIKEVWNFPEFTFEKKFNAEISEGIYKLQATSYKLLLVKPQTFMNLSGESVRKILDFYKLTPKDIIVIHDDLDIEIGKYKIADNSSSAGHNGVQNIIDQLGTQEFKRIRVGIGVGNANLRSENGTVCKLNAHDFVLGKFKDEELEKIKKISEDIIEVINKLV